MSNVPQRIPLPHDIAAWQEFARTLSDADLRVFRMLLLQRWLGLADRELVAEVEDRLSLRRFCGIAAEGAVPQTKELADLRYKLMRPDHAGELRDAADLWTAPDDEPLISVVSPAYRAEAIIDTFVRSVGEALSAITANYEIVLVEDGSPDETWEQIAIACTADPRVRGVRLSRNFGQHKAITAGLETARGRWVVVMDCDLQDDPAFIAELFAKACEGHDVVLTTRPRRAHGWIKNLCARAFAMAMNRLSEGTPSDPLIGGFSMLSRRAVDAFRQIHDVHRHYLSVVRWLGFETGYVQVEHRPRHSGSSSYTPLKLIRHAIDGWISHSNRLLYTSVALGFTCLALAVTATIAIVVLYFTHGFMPGWPSLVVLILLSTGMVLVSLGVLGIYIGKIFDQVRARPLFIVEETRNVQEPARVAPAILRHTRREE